MIIHLIYEQYNELALAMDLIAERMIRELVAGQEAVDGALGVPAGRQSERRAER